MRLLVSVASAAEASAALAGGADFIDAKNPLMGALGAVSEEVLRDIHAAVGGVRPVTAALGDAADEAEIEDAACVFAAAGAALVKVGFAGITSVPRAVALTMAAVRGAAAGGRGRSGVVAVAYADADRVASLAAGALVEVACTRRSDRGAARHGGQGGARPARAYRAGRAREVGGRGARGRASCGPRGQIDDGRSRVRPRCRCRHRRRTRRRVRRRTNRPRVASEEFVCSERCVVRLDARDTSVRTSQVLSLQQSVAQVFRPARSPRSARLSASI